MNKFLNRFLFIFLFLSMGRATYAQDNQVLIQASMNEKASTYNLTPEDVQSWAITDTHQDKNTGIWYYYLTQKFSDLLLHNAITVVAIKDQKAFLTASGFIAGLAQKTETTTSTISAKDAILSGARSLGIKISGDITQREKIDKNHYIFNAYGLSKEEIVVQLKLFQTDEETIRTVWDLDIYQLDQKHWWSIRVDAQTGVLLDKVDWVLDCTFKSNDPPHSNNHQRAEITPEVIPRSGAGYNVFAIPVETPNHGSRSLEIDPADPIASPFGWHDINGVVGAEFTTTQGNNVYANEDLYDTDLLGYMPDGGTALNFDFPLDLNQAPINNLDAAITNLFYMNNIMHDVWYQYGFDEASGNFQKNNYGNGGWGEDHVDAQAQDGGGKNNANMAIGPDGYRPRMQMYLWRSYAPYLLYVNSPYAISGDYFTRQAYFGPKVTSTPITSDIVIYNDNVSDPMDGCESAVNGADINGKIVLIKKGTCDYTLQVHNAENAGAIAVIVVNDVGGYPPAMSGVDLGIGIPSIIISSTDGAYIITQIQNNVNVNATIQGMPGDFDFDGDFDNGIMAHEYGHGISVRLTGGASMAGCLNNEEQMGEGWSDWFALMLTMKPGDIGTDGRGMSTYVNGESPTGNGLRLQKYSTDINVDNVTYGITNDTIAIYGSHEIGFVWATMLWDLSWKLIDKYGYDPDVYNGTGGNNIAMHLIINGLKLQNCEPGFVDGRDAILLADELLYNGENQCLIWQVFANRGLGYSADQGSSDSRIDQIEAFDLPPYIGSGSESVTYCGDFTWPTNNQTYTNSGTYTEIISGVNGCDSMVTLNLTINNIDTQVAIGADEITLISTSGFSAYQWINCDNNFAVIQGANNSSFTASSNGNYAVIINDGTCSDTSACLTINKLNLHEEVKNGIKIYPNPTNEMVNIDFLESSEVSTIKVYDMIGKLVQEFKVENQEQFKFFLRGESGVYTIEIQTHTGTVQRTRLTKLN